jgi:CO dehydrogenase maturation factor
MKLAIAGKGGSGKTTLSAALARVLARGGKQVWAIDGDPNPNLGIALGIPREVLEKAPRVPRNIVQERRDDEGVSHMDLKEPLADLQRRYAITGPDGVHLMFVTGLDHAGQG